MARHIRQYCKIANGEEGMEKLFDHTLQKQMAVMRAENAEMRDQVTKLASLMERQMMLAAAGRPSPPEARMGGAITSPQVNTGIISISQQNNTVIIKPVMPWDETSRISVTISQIAAAFEENARLKEYAKLEEHQLTDPVIAPPYVAELPMDLTKRAHADPAARNVYLNPKRADQALVHMTSGKWEVVSLHEAMRLIFDGVAKAMVRVTMSSEERRQLPLEAQNALAMAGLLYDDEPEEYARKAKMPMAAHLSNTTPLLAEA